MRMSHVAIWNIDQEVGLVENITICHFGGRRVIDLVDLEMNYYNNAQLR